MPNDYLDGFILGETTYDMKDPNLTERVDAVEEAMEHKAEIDGYYEGMTVGNAEQVVSTVGIEDQVPYTFRTSGGSIDIGDRENDAIVGGTVAWNQLMQNGDFASSEGWTKSNEWIFANGKATFNVNASAVSFYNLYQAIDTVVNHKYLVSCDVTGYNGTPTDCRLAVDSGFGNYPRVIANIRENEPTQGIVSATNNSLCAGIKIQLASGQTLTLSISNFMFIDLTQMFGSAIADYIYSLETAHAGDGIAFFRKLFPKPYYAYNPGELLSVEGLQSHDMTGFNQWDEEWELGKYNVSTGAKETNNNVIRCKNKIPVCPGTRYFINANYAISCCYDANGDYISSTPYAYVPGGNAYYLDIPSNAYFITFNMGTNYGTTYKNDICINLHWDGERDGEYEPYTLHSYPLDSSLTLRGIPKLDSNNKLYYDGDVYEHDGKVTRKYGYVDMGAIGWQYDSTNSRFCANGLNAKRISTSRSPILCPKYVYSDVLTSSGVGFISSSTSPYELYIYDSSYTDAATFKTAMSGVMLVYELATPTTETADPFSDPQIVNDWGTEEYVTDSIVPTGHRTNYQPNLRAKLEMAPDSPEGDGDYIVRQSNGENTYVPLVIPAELPTSPTTDGTYTLQVTVSNGTATLAWVSE